MCSSGNMLMTAHNIDGQSRYHADQVRTLVLSELPGLSILQLLDSRARGTREVMEVEMETGTIGTSTAPDPLFRRVHTLVLDQSVISHLIFGLYGRQDRRLDAKLGQADRNRLSLLRVLTSRPRKIWYEGIDIAKHGYHAWAADAASSEDPGRKSMLPWSFVEEAMTTLLCAWDEPATERNRMSEITHISPRYIGL
jgi:hypothetical protein